jgi:uncharacterized protein (TIGR00730 family)
MSSSDAVEQGFVDLALELGGAIGRNGHTLVFGGNRTGLMGKVADAAKEQGGHVIGVVPQKLHDMGRAYENCDKLIVTKDLRDRKAIMDEHADAFVALPGGLGTLEEIIEVLNLKFLRYHQKPVVFMNYRDFYQPLFRTFESFYQQHFTKPDVEKLYAALPSVAELFPYLENYVPVEVDEKWYDRT